MAERGIEAVELKDIVAAAGQRNRSAIRYHFGDRDGLVRAIGNKHRVRINAERNRLLDELPEHPRPGLRQLVEIGVRPNAASLATQSGRNFLIILGERSATVGTPDLVTALQPNSESIRRLHRLMVSSFARESRCPLRPDRALPAHRGGADGRHRPETNRGHITVRQAIRRTELAIDHLTGALLYDIDDETPTT